MILICLSCVFHYNCYISRRLLIENNLINLILVSFVCPMVLKTKYTFKFN